MIRTRPGLTLLELLCSLALLSVLLGMVATPVARARDVLAVRGARAAIMHAAATARALACRHGGAELSIAAAEGVLSIATRDAVVNDTVARLLREYHTSLSFDDARLPAAVIRFDALGLGRLASRTVHVRRGAVSGHVTFSAYGRARAW